jgi:hypothetical protein
VRKKNRERVARGNRKNFRLDYLREVTDQRRKIQQKFYQEKGAPKFAKFKWVGLSKGKEERRFYIYTCKILSRIL